MKNQPCGNTIAEIKYDGGGNITDREMSQFREDALDSEWYAQTLSEWIGDNITETQWKIIDDYRRSGDYLQAGIYLGELMKPGADKCLRDEMDRLIQEAADDRGC